MVSSLLRDDCPGIVTEQYITADAAVTLTDCNIQYVRRLALSGKLGAIHVGRSWLIKVESLGASGPCRCA